MRVVSGKGEFEFPAWKPHDAKPTSGRQCLTIRCARRHKLHPTTKSQTLYAAFHCSGGQWQRCSCAGVELRCACPHRMLLKHESEARCRPKEK